MFTATSWRSLIPTGTVFRTINPPWPGRGPCPTRFLRCPHTLSWYWIASCGRVVFIDTTEPLLWVTVTVEAVAASWMTPGGVFTTATGCTDSLANKVITLFVGAGTTTPYAFPATIRVGGSVGVGPIG